MIVRIPLKYRIRLNVSTDHESFVIADSLSTIAPIERANKKMILVGASRAIRKKIKVSGICI